LDAVSVGCCVPQVLPKSSDLRSKTSNKNDSAAMTNASSVATATVSEYLQDFKLEYEEGDQDPRYFMLTHHTSLTKTPGTYYHTYCIGTSSSTVLITDY
jgi:hypothetical protein